MNLPATVWTVTATLTVTALAALPATAQVQAGSGGRALDANQQVGSGAINGQVSTPDFRARNDVVTGNAGFRSFRGDVNYRASGEFFGNLGSNTLFDFSSQSIPSTNRNYNNTRAPGQGGATVFRNFTEVPAYRTGGQLVSPTGQPGGGFQVLRNSAQVGTGEVDRYQIGSTALIQQNVAPTRAESIGVVTQMDGTTVGIQASPLLGVRRVGGPTQRSGLMVNDALAPKQIDPDDAAISAELRLDQDQRIDGRKTRVSEELGTPGLQQVGTPVGASLMLGTQIQSRLYAELSSDDIVSLDDRAKKLKDMIYSPLGSRTAQQGEDVYLDLLRSIQSGEGGARNSLTGADSALSGTLDDPTSRDLERAEALRDEAYRNAFGATPEEAAEDSEAETDGALGDLISELDYELPPLETLAGATEDRVNKLLREAESQLIAGKYLSAEALYRQVLVNNEKLPMARVGLTHAQLGAGMIRSAAFNLRLLFESHPELIAARYSSDLLPNEKRLQWLQDELQKMINGSNSAGDAGLMMAYLGHQVGSRQLSRYGLAIAESENPGDPLTPVLRVIWLDEE